MSEEQWKQIRDLDYEVSSHGRVRRKSRPEMFLKPQGYLRVCLVKNGKSFRPTIHRIVAETFLGFSTDETKDQVNHKDGNHGNNCVENLEWMTQRENQLHAVRTGIARNRGEQHGRAKLTDDQIIEIRRRYTGQFGQQTLLAKEFGVSQSSIAKIVRSASWTHLAASSNASQAVGHGAALTKEQAVEIRRRYTGKYGEHVAFAKEFDVPVHAIRRVVRGETWKTLSGTRIYEVVSGANHGRSKLTPNQIRWARNLFSKGVSLPKLAKRYKISVQTIRDIVYDKTWKHVV